MLHFCFSLRWILSDCNQHHRSRFATLFDEWISFAFITPLCSLLESEDMF